MRNGLEPSLAPVQPGDAPVFDLIAALTVVRVVAGLFLLASRRRSIPALALGLASPG